MSTETATNRQRLCASGTHYRVATRFDECCKYLYPQRLASLNRKKTAITSIAQGWRGPVRAFSWAPNPDLSKVDEAGFADLMPGSGHGSGGWVNYTEIEVDGKAVPRDESGGGNSGH